MNKQILYRYQDGPNESPNGFLLVTPIEQGTMRNFFRCQVVAVLKATGRVAEVGSIIETDGSKLELYWRED